MIPVARRKAPKGFHAKVFRPGMAWLKANGIAKAQKAPAGTSLRPFWRRCLRQLHARYDGVCAYLAVWIERCTGAASADHFVAKSKLAGDAYRWSNLRLACVKMNARKRDFADVLDPFTLAPGTFRLELVTGRIYVNKTLPKPLRDAARATIRRLGLDDGGNRRMRARHFDDYLTFKVQSIAGAAAPEDFLRRHSPFVWYEAKRQGVL